MPDMLVLCVNPACPRDALEVRAGSAALASVIAFGVIAIGGIGSVVAGVMADRLGRTMITSVAMIVSGSSALLAAVRFDAPQEQRRPFCYMMAAWVSWSNPPKNFSP
jgi:MFS family permease